MPKRLRESAERSQITFTKSLSRQLQELGQEKLAALQIILFLLDQPVVPEQEHTQLLHKLLPQLNTKTRPFRHGSF